MTLTGFAACAHTFCALKLMRARSSVVIPQIGIAMGFLLQISMSCARFRKGVGAGAGVVVLGADGRRRWSGAGAAAGVVSWQSAPVLVSAGCARCGGAVSWLCRLRTFLFQPVACQQVVGFCLAIWVYAGVICLTS